MEAKLLHQIVKERADLQSELNRIYSDFAKRREGLETKIKQLQLLEAIGCEGIDVERVQIAEKVLHVAGNPYGKPDSGPEIANLAIVDIANDCERLKRCYFGNKEYASFYQRCDCEYGYGPSHGYIVDRIGLNSNYRLGKLNDTEKDACIYYLKNYKKIQAAKQKEKQTN